MVGTIVFDWLSKEEERSDYVVSFKSGALVGTCLVLHLFSMIYC